ncbi:MAG: LysR substrate-binding domain-containing protein [Devosiaceae bacterium]|nr:LysR substrate-binding domain-containing protein [Devosiaceae bacterium]
MSHFLEMKVFVKIVDAGSISKAADQLGIAKSAISRRLSELERRLGVTLLTRTTRTSSLTEVGHSYYQRATQILSDVSELDADISSNLLALKGSINVAVPSSFGLLHLTSTIDDFAKQHSGIKINLNFSDRQVDLIEEGYDLAIRIGDLKDSALIARKIAPIEMRICASPDYLAKNGTPQHPKELKTHSGLHYEYSSGNAWKFIDTDGQVQSVKTPIKMIANNGDFLQNMALSSHGIAILPTFIISQSLQNKTLLPILRNYSIPHLNAYLVYPQTRHLSKRVRTFIDFLIERFAGQPYWDVKE